MTLAILQRERVDEASFDGGCRQIGDVGSIRRANQHSMKFSSNNNFSHSMVKCHEGAASRPATELAPQDQERRGTYIIYFS